MLIEPAIDFDSAPLLQLLQPHQTHVQAIHVHVTSTKAVLDLASASKRSTLKERTVPTIVHKKIDLTQYVILLCLLRYLLEPSPHTCLTISCENECPVNICILCWRQFHQMLEELTLA